MTQTFLFYTQCICRNCEINQKHKIRHSSDKKNSNSCVLILEEGDKVHIDSWLVYDLTELITNVSNNFENFDKIEGSVTTVGITITQ